MLKSGIPLGKFFGIDVRLHFSWFFIFYLITWSLSSVYFPTTFPDWTQAMKIGAGLLTSLLYFTSVLIHELSHSLVAIREGIAIKSITLFFLGGISSMAEEPKSARDEFRMAVAGPLSSLILGGIFMGLNYALRGQTAVAAQFVTAIAFYIGYINLFLGIFNLIPGFPLDGGRVVRSIIWWRTGDLGKATRISAGIGRAFSYLFVFFGVFLIFSGDVFNGMWLAMIGWFLGSAATSTQSQQLVQEMLKGHVAREIMSQDCAAVSPAMPIESFVSDIMMISGRRCFPVVLDDRAEGLITLTDVRAVPRSEWSTTTVRQAMTPLDKIESVGPDEDLSRVLQILAEKDVNQVPVVKDGNIIGMIARDNLINFIHVRSQLSR